MKRMMTLCVSALVLTLGTTNVSADFWSDLRKKTTGMDRNPFRVPPATSELAEWCSICGAGSISRCNCGRIPPKSNTSGSRPDPRWMRDINDALKDVQTCPKCRQMYTKGTPHRCPVMMPCMTCGGQFPIGTHLQSSARCSNCGLFYNPCPNKPHHQCAPQQQRQTQQVQPTQPRQQVQRQQRQVTQYDQEPVQYIQQPAVIRS